jgi:hypothetical protein
MGESVSQSVISLPLTKGRTKVERILLRAVVNYCPVDAILVGLSPPVANFLPCDTPTYCGPT